MAPVTGAVKGGGGLGKGLQRPPHANLFSSNPCGPLLILYPAHPMARGKMEDVAPHLGLRLAQSTQMQMSNLRNRKLKQTPHPNMKQRCS